MILVLMSKTLDDTHSSPIDLNVGHVPVSAGFCQRVLEFVSRQIWCGKELYYRFNLFCIGYWQACVVHTCCPSGVPGVYCAWSCGGRTKDMFGLASVRVGQGKTVAVVDRPLGRGFPGGGRGWLPCSSEQRAFHKLDFFSSFFFFFFFARVCVKSSCL